MKRVLHAPYVMINHFTDNTTGCLIHFIQSFNPTIPLPLLSLYALMHKIASVLVEKIVFKQMAIKIYCTTS